MYIIKEIWWGGQFKFEIRFESIEAALEAIRSWWVEYENIELLIIFDDTKHKIIATVIRGIKNELIITSIIPVPQVEVYVIDKLLKTAKVTATIINLPE